MEADFEGVMEDVAPDNASDSGPEGDEEDKYVRRAYPSNDMPYFDRTCPTATFCFEDALHTADPLRELHTSGEACSTTRTQGTQNGIAIPACIYGF